MAATSAFRRQRDHRQSDRLTLAQAEGQAPCAWVALCVAPWAYHFIWRVMRKSQGGTGSGSRHNPIRFWGPCAGRPVFR